MKGTDDVNTSPQQLFGCRELRFGLFKKLGCEA
jgi:hypothetical protein